MFGFRKVNVEQYSEKQNTSGILTKANKQLEGFENAIVQLKPANDFIEVYIGDRKIFKIEFFHFTNIRYGEIDRVVQYAALERVNNDFAFGSVKKRNEVQTVNAKITYINIIMKNGEVIQLKQCSNSKRFVERLEYILKLKE